MLGHQDGRDIVIGDALFLEVEDHRKGKAENGVDIALGEHRFTHRKTDRFDLDLAVVETRHLLEGRPLRESAIRRRRAELLAFQRLRITGDTQRLAADHGESRALIDHIYGLDLLARIFVEELHHRIDIAETHLIGARRHARNGFHRTIAAVDGDIQALSLEVTLVERQQETRGGAFELPVEREFHRCFGPRLHSRQRKAGGYTDGGNGQSPAQQPAR
ncbi:hypothetical protein D3C87_753330 [compost metagenome]